METGLLFNLESLLKWTNLTTKRDLIKALHRLGIPFAELANGEVVTLYSALQQGFKNEVMMDGDELIRIDEVMKMTKVCRASLHKYVKDGTFPAKVKLGPKKIAWKKLEVLQWVEGKRDW